MSRPLRSFGLRFAALHQKHALAVDLPVEQFAARRAQWRSVLRRIVEMADYAFANPPYVGKT
jgi:hypothetical protein